MSDGKETIKKDNRIKCNSHNCNSKQFLMFSSPTGIEYRCIVCNTPHYFQNVTVRTISFKDQILLDKENNK